MDNTMKKALITGATSGIGKDMAAILHNKGYELILTGRNEEVLEELNNELSPCRTIALDISAPESCFSLYEEVKDENIDLLINNAGYGIFGGFDETSLEDELNLIDLNIKAVHILTKLFLKDFIKKDSGTILNVASSAGLMSGGPLLSSYYASKAYVLRLSEAIYEELRRKKSKVKIAVFCPGPVNTNFNKRAGVRFSVRGLSSEEAAAYAIKKLKSEKLIIVPRWTIRAGLFVKRFVSEKFLLRVTYHFQHSKKNR